MITDEERRNVAANIRSEAERRKYSLQDDLDYSPFAALYVVFCGVRGFPHYEDLLHLADLIEPEPERTCRMLEVETGEVADYRDTDEVIFHCESCHAERGIFSYDEDGNVYSARPEYCPYCGAKVVGRC